MDTITINRLAHFVSLSTDYRRQDLVINALFISSSALTTNELELLIRSEYKCIISQNEIHKILQHLKKNNLVEEMPKDHYILTLDLTNNLNHSLNIGIKLEDEVMNAWSEELRTKHPLSEEEINYLINKLKEFLNRLFYNHGAEGLNLITNSYKNNDEIMNDVNDIISSLNIDESLLEVASIEFKSFLSSKNNNIINYLVALIKRVVSYLTEICDPDAINLIKSNLSMNKLYLDTNIVFRLIDLQGEARKVSTLEVLQLCKDNGIKVVVTTKTIKELESTIKFFRKLLIDNPLPSSLSRIAYRFRSADNYLSVYWKESEEHNISVDDFNERYKNIDLILQSLGIQIEDVSWFDGEISEVKRVFESKFHMFLEERNNNGRSISGIEHDAYHLALVNYLRDTSKQRFSEVESFFLTSDQWLSKFQYTLQELKDSDVPLALKPSNIINIFQFIEPEDGKYAEVFLNIFSKTTYIPTKITNDIIHKIGSKIASVRYSPQIYEKILSNQYITTIYNGLKEDQDKDKLIELAIDEEVEKMSQEISDIKSKNQLLENKLIEQEQQEIELHETFLTAIKEVSATNEKAIEMKQAELNISKEDARILLDKLNKQTRNIKIFFTFIIIVLMLAEYFVDYYILTNIFDKFLRMIINIVLAAVLFLIYHFLLFKKNTGYIITAYIGVLAIYFSILK